MLAAYVLLGILCLGSAAHGWHHLTDPGCDLNAERGGPPCACAALHGGAVSAELAIAVPTQPTTLTEFFPDGQQRPVPPALAAGTPRAPPVS